MLLLRAERIKKIYGDRIVLDIEELSIYTGDRIGVVGANGAGKTTLFQLLAGELEPEEGRTERYGAVAYCRQFESNSLQMTEKENVALQDTGRKISVWQVPERMSVDEISGGELMRRKLAEVFAGEGHVLLLDEPTNYLDLPSIKALEKQLIQYEGTVLFVSHDRAFVQNTAQEILQIENREILKFSGTLTEWESEKKRRREWETQGNTANGGKADSRKNVRKDEEERMLLELQLARLTGQLGHAPSLQEKERLEAEYWEITEKLRHLKG